jgi:hypothetical protein
MELLRCRSTWIHIHCCFVRVWVCYPTCHVINATDFVQFSFHAGHYRFAIVKSGKVLVTNRLPVTYSPLKQLVSNCSIFFLPAGVTSSNPQILQILVQDPGHSQWPQSLPHSDRSNEFPLRGNINAVKMLGYQSAVRLLKNTFLAASHAP